MSSRWTTFHSAFDDISTRVSHAADLTREIVSKVENVHEAMTTLDASAKEIAGFTEEIDKIAFQTKILSMNASIEAARAGAAGREFSVVAGEVKSLSGRVGDATKSVHAQTTSIMEGAARAAGVHDEVRECLKEINSTNTNVAHTVKEEAATVSQMNSTVRRIGTQCTRMVENVKRTADETDLLADDVKETYEQMLKFG